MAKIYKLRDPAPHDVRVVLAEHPELLQDLLFSRGISDPQAAQQFLEPRFERDSHDPFLLPDMEAAVERILSAIKNDELIVVWSDYDCDGVPGGVALCEFLRDIGARVRQYIPDRHVDGFGLNNEGVKELAEQQAALVITVDCGTTDVVQAAFAKEKGIDLIITDHHLPLARHSESRDGRLDELPDALVVNPHRQGSAYPFKELCGAGVAWKLVQAILQQLEKSGQPITYARGKEKWLLDLIGLATLSDMVPLVDENRMLAAYGLLVMRKNRRPGLRALFNLLRIKAETVGEDDLTFMISPRINAASRLEKAETAAQLLATKDAFEAKETAAALNRINDERKGLVAAAIKDARKRLGARDSENDPLIVVGNPGWRPGILGLVAQKLAEESKKPSFVWGRGGANLIKGSCRAYGAINMVDLMAGAKEIFEDYGGHEFSGGFSLREENVHRLSPALMESYGNLRMGEALSQEIMLDRELDIAEAAGALSEVQKLSPYGEGNRKPLFSFPNVSIAKMRTFGKAGDHLELSLQKNASDISGIAFFSNPESFDKKISDGISADIMGHIELDWRNRPRLRIVDVL